MKKKSCGKCQEELPATTEFFATKTRNGKIELQWICRSCQKEYRKSHYEANKNKYIQKASDYRNKIVDWFKEYKKGLKCEKCGEDRPWVLDFHHVNPLEKDIEVIHLIRASSKKRALKEIDKCMVLCANCHRDHHYQERLNASIA